MTDDETCVELLSRTDLFKLFDLEDRAECARKFRELKLAKGEMLFGRGEPGAHLYVVKKGQVRLAIGTDEGRELSFQIVGPGDLFGEIAVLDGNPRSAQATALAASVLYSLERNDFFALMAKSPGIARAVISYLCRRLREVSDKLETIALYSLDVRLARFLLIALKDQPDIPGRRLPLELQYSQGELALLLGASRPKINMALSALEGAQAIKRTADRLFCDRAKLASLAKIEDF
jgi:CRP/FNR family cyclic AMP-dependent transcriptional regulator